MKISREKLYQIILEEYAIEEGILDEALSPEKTAELIAWIKGKGPRPDWATDDSGTSGAGKAVQSPANPDVDRAADTMPLPPRSAQDDDPAASSAEVHPIKAAVDGIYELVADMDPEDVAEIFQIVFEKLPGVEMQDAEPEPETLYSPGAEGRPQAGFRLEELKDLIRKVLAESV